MAAELPYLVTNKRLPELFSQIRSAAVPSRFSFEFLKKLGFASSNDRALPSLLKKLGFLDAAGVPTERYKVYRQKDQSRRVLADSIREVYSDLFAINENVHKESREAVKGIVSRVTGAEEKYVNLTASTFQALVALADFSAAKEATAGVPLKEPGQKEQSPQGIDRQRMTATSPSEVPSHSIAFRHNIEIHLPATANISVYNAIFKSLKEHLL